jgi:hypothetical protein
VVSEKTFWFESNRMTGGLRTAVGVCSKKLGRKPDPQIPKALLLLKDADNNDDQIGDKSPPDTIMMMRKRRLMEERGAMLDYQQDNW